MYCRPPFNKLCTCSTWRKKIECKLFKAAWATGHRVLKGFTEVIIDVACATQKEMKRVFVDAKGPIEVKKRCNSTGDSTPEEMRKGDRDAQPTLPEKILTDGTSGTAQWGLTEYVLVCMISLAAAGVLFCILRALYHRNARFRLAAQALINMVFVFGLRLPPPVFGHRLGGPARHVGGPARRVGGARRVAIPLPPAPVRPAPPIPVQPPVVVVPPRMLVPAAPVRPLPATPGGAPAPAVHQSPRAGRVVSRSRCTASCCRSPPVSSENGTVLTTIWEGQYMESSPSLRRRQENISRILEHTSPYYDNVPRGRVDFTIDDSDYDGDDEKTDGDDKKKGE